MNDEEKMSSSNTTPFNNVNKHNKVLNNDKLAKYTGFRQLRPRNNVNNENINGRINDIPPVSDKKDDSKQQNNDNEVSNNNKRNVRRNPFGPKNRLNNTASNLRDKLDTNPDMKDEVAKKGAESLKKSANPYAKAAGYAASFLQKKKEKKKKEENKDDEKKDENDNEKNEDNKDDSSTSLLENKTRTRLIIHLTLLILPYVLGFIIIISTFLPLLNAYSWFQSLFHHKSDDADSYYIYNDNQKEKSDEEIAFNDAIVGSKDGSVKGIIQEYKEKYGVTIDKYLLVATVTYRYSVVDSDKVYSDDGNNDINDEEINSRLEELEENDSNDSNEETNNSETNNSVDYSKAKKKINAVAALMIKRNGSSYTTDKEVGGDFYNTLIDSQFLKDYYKDLLSDDKYETRKRLVDEIFEYAEGARLMDDEEEEKTVNGGVVGDTSIVYLQSCTEPQQYKTKFVGNHEIYDNKLVNEGTNYPLYLSLKDYIKGVIYRENFSTDEKYRESIKVQAIMALSFLLRDSKSGFDLKNGEMYFPTETCRQATCDPNYGCTSVSGVASYSGTDRGNGTTHRALNEKEQTYLDSILDEVFGLVIVKKGVTTSSFSGSGDLVSFNYCNTLGECSSCRSGSCVGQTEANNDAASGMDYKAIFAKYFTSLEYDIINITDGLYYESSGDNFNGTINLNESFHYHQGDSPWGSQNLCDSGFISDNGCNITSAAIVISLLKNERITPETLNNRQSENPYCKQSSRPQMIQQFGKMYGLNVQIVNKGNTMEVHDMVLKIASGKYAATARIAENSGRYATGSGHYVAIVGARSSNGTDQILVWDPATKSSSRDNAWVDVNYLIKYLQPEYSFILMGS